VDEVWVPTDFHVEVFARSGVNREKLVKIPEATDVYMWDPAIVQPLNLTIIRPQDFNFFSVFKWEHRKGWDVLLRGYFEEFSPSENVTLFIHTYLYDDPFDPRNDNKILSLIFDFAKTEMNRKPETLPRIKVISQEHPRMMMPRLYKSFNAFVLPTRGEGWGLPIMEAMAMEMPTIATNWSGPTEFLSMENSFPLEVEKVVDDYAKPSIPHLRKLMRYVFEDREEAKIKGKRARMDIVSKYSQEKVAELVMDRLKQIEDKSYTSS